MVLWDMVTASQIHVFEHQMHVICCCFSPDSRFAVSGCQDEVCRVWDLQSGIEVTSFAEHEGAITSVNYSPDGNLVVSADRRCIKVWNMYTALCLRTFEGHTKIPMFCQYSADGESIATIDSKTLNIWDAINGDLTRSLNISNIQPLSTVRQYDTQKFRFVLCLWCPPPFSSFFVTSCSDRTIRIFHHLSGEEHLVLSCKAVACCASGLRDSVDPRAARILFGDAYGNIYVLTMRC
jgi:WD40 repeat protein